MIIYIFLITFGYYFLRVSVPMYQVSSITDILYYDYRLSGSKEMLNAISHHERVKQRVARSTKCEAKPITYNRKFLLQFPEKQIEGFRICANIDDCLRDLKWDYYGAVGASRQNILNSEEFSALKIFCFDYSQDIQTFPISLSVRKNLKLKPEIDRIIRHLFETGLFVEWERDNKKRAKYEYQYFPDLIGLDHFKIVFLVVLGVGWTLSLSTLFCERLIFRKMQQRVGNRHRIWIRLERFVDGERHYLKNILQK